MTVCPADDRSAAELTALCLVAADDGSVYLKLPTAGVLGRKLPVRLFIDRIAESLAQLGVPRKAGKVF